MASRIRVGMTPEEMKARVERGELQVHKFGDGFALTEVKTFPEERVLFVHLLGGVNFNFWKAEADAKLRRFAQDNLCTAIEATCRLGIAKAAIPFGWRKTRVVIRTEIK